MPGIATRKAALLLMNLEPDSAAELLRGLQADTVQDIAAEMTYLHRRGVKDEEKKAPLREFYGVLLGRQVSHSGEAFVRRLLTDALGPEQSQRLLAALPEIVNQRDPFLAVRTADVETIAAAVDGESPLVAALVLSELSSAQSARLLPLLPDEIRAAAVRGMTSVEKVAPETRRRVATLVRRRLEELQSSGGGATSPDAQRQAQLRKVAILLRGLETDLRDKLLSGISEKDPATATEVQDLMVTWDDILEIADRSLQEVLRKVNSKKLALALVGADDRVVEKIRGNISERAVAMLDEEAQLLSTPRDSEVQEGRDEILAALRELNQAGELRFVGG